MLIRTRTRAFELADDGSQAAPVEWLDAPRASAIVAGCELRAAALDQGRLACGRGPDRWAIRTAVRTHIESMLILREDPPELLLGTEPPHLFRVLAAPQGGREADGRAESAAQFVSADRVESFDRLPSRPRWHTPWGGPPAVRSLAASGDGWVYADIHVGSIMRSGDGGRLWRSVEPGLNEDVHQVATSPAAPERVYANTARAVFISEDRGDSWRDCGADLGHRYGRAIAVDPSDPDLILASVSDGPHEDHDVRGQLWRSEDVGRTWTHVTEGFPASNPRNINTLRIGFSHGGLAWASVGAILYMGRDRARRWSEFWTAPEGIESISLA